MKVFSFIFLLLLSGPALAQPLPKCQYGVALHEWPTNKAPIEEVISRRRCVPKSVAMFLQWTKESWQPYPLKDILKTASSYGMTPIITWEPMQYIEGKQRGIAYERILKGEFDEYIDQIADTLAMHNANVIVRLAHEMNLSQYHWGVVTEQEFSPKNVEIFQKIFRYVVRRVRNRPNTKNVLFAFNPNFISVPSGYKQVDWNHFRNYYPGDKYVDLVGLDGYNWGNTLVFENWQSSWQSPEEIFGSTLDDLKDLAPSKPLYIFETASVGTDQQKEKWLSDLIKLAQSKGVVDVTWFHINKENDWRLPFLP